MQRPRGVGRRHGRPAATLTTQASPGVAVGGQVTDTATLSGATNPTGAITFTLFGPDDATCAGTPAFTSSPVPVNGNGSYPSAAFTPTAPGTYRWVAVYSGDAINAAITSPCNAPNESVLVTSTPVATLTTQASPSAPVGGQIFDTATLSGAANPTGTITFTLFGPDDATCAGPSVFTSTKPINGNGTFPSDFFTPTAPGTYRWVASYSGDANNASITNPCNSPNESVVVSGQLPMIFTTQASASVGVGGAIADIANLSGGLNPTGTIAFSLFGPDDATCSGAPAFTSTVPVNGSGIYNSGSYIATASGTYRWVAVYSGDANNTAVTSPCNAPNESVVVTSTPEASLTTQASPSVPVGGQITDTATLSGATNPTGIITFLLYGPDNATCSGAAIFTSDVSVTGNGQYTSAPFTPTAPGTYRWIATYGFDNDNNPPPTFCNDPNESVVVTQVGPITPTLTTAASQTGPSYTDTATLAGGTNPTGTISFTLFGPDNATCTGTPAFTSTVTVTGNGQHTSTPFTPTAPGTYRWVAAYSGDVNHAAVPTSCNDPAESFVVGGPPPPVTIVTQASPSVAVGGQLTDTATLTGGTSPTGTVTFVLFGPDDATCAGPPAFTSTKTVTGTGTYTSDPFTTTVPGTYRWRATYSGDANHAGAATPCDDPAETVTVTPVTPTPCIGSQSAGTHMVGETFIIVFTPACGFASPPPVIKTVNGVVVGSQPATNGTASVTITVVSPTTLSVDDPVLVPAVCGVNTATATGVSATGQPVTQTATFTVDCGPLRQAPQGPPVPQGRKGRKGLEGLPVLLVHRGSTGYSALSCRS